MACSQETISGGTDPDWGENLSWGWADAVIGAGCGGQKKADPQKQTRTRGTSPSPGGIIRSPDLPRTPHPTPIRALRLGRVCCYRKVGPRQVSPLSGTHSGHSTGCLRQEAQCSTSYAYFSSSAWKRGWERSASQMGSSSREWTVSQDGAGRISSRTSTARSCSSK